MTSLRTLARRPTRFVLATVWLALVGLAVVAGSCSIDKRSGEFSLCERREDCPGGQLCSQGVCVSSTDGGVSKDSSVPADALTCPSQCTSCKLETMACKVDCAVSPATCNAPIVCPAGWNCEIACTVAEACRSGIDCSAGASCNINCQGANTCRDLVCGEGPCGVRCAGTGSCRGVDCGPSCACDVSCSPSSLCEGVSCSAAACSTFGGGCTSQVPTCNVCP